MGVTIPGREPFRTAAQTLLDESGCVVRSWRSRPTSGSADIQSTEWEIEVPEPRGAVSFGTFAHEVAHQLLHRTLGRPRWLEEIEAWEFALAQFDRFELPGVGACRRDARKALLYTATKANRRISNPDTAAAIVVRYAWVWGRSRDDIDDDIRQRASATLELLGAARA